MRTIKNINKFKIPKFSVIRTITRKSEDSPEGYTGPDSYLKRQLVSTPLLRTIACMYSKESNDILSSPKASKFNQMLIYAHCFCDACNWQQHTFKVDRENHF